MRFRGVDDVSSGCGAEPSDEKLVYLHYVHDQHGQMDI